MPRNPQFSQAFTQPRKTKRRRKIHFWRPKTLDRKRQTNSKIGAFCLFCVWFFLLCECLGIRRGLGFWEARNQSRPPLPSAPSPSATQKRGQKILSTNPNFGNRSRKRKRSRGAEGYLNRLRLQVRGRHGSLQKKKNEVKRTEIAKPTRARGLLPFSSFKKNEIEVKREKRRRGKREQVPSALLLFFLIIIF